MSKIQKQLTSKAERVWALDAFRGIAVLQMIFWQIFDFLGKVNIYSDPPFYSSALNMSVNWVGLPWFTFIAGTGMYLSLQRRKMKGQSIQQIAQHFLKRYGGLILVSLILTAYMGSLCTFFGWGEALQGIGLSVLATFVILSFVNSDLAIISLILIIAFGQQLIRDNFLPLENGFPGCPVGGNALVHFSTNIMFTGLFALTHMIPFVLGGVLLGKLIERRKTVGKTAAIYGVVAIFIGFAIGQVVYDVNAYGRTPPYIIFMIGTSFLLYYIVEKLEKFQNVLKPIMIYGQAAIVVYLLHFGAIYRPAQLLGIVDSLPNNLAIIASIFFTIILYFAGLVWLRYKNRLHF